MSLRKFSKRLRFWRSWITQTLSKFMKCSKMKSDFTLLLNFAQAGKFLMRSLTCQTKENSSLRNMLPSSSSKFSRQSIIATREVLFIETWNLRIFWLKVETVWPLRSSILDKHRISKKTKICMRKLGLCFSWLQKYSNITIMKSVTYGV